jgi:hypothetical protein
MSVYKNMNPSNEETTDSENEPVQNKKCNVTIWSCS